MTGLPRSLGHFLVVRPHDDEPIVIGPYATPAEARAAADVYAPNEDEGDGWDVAVHVPPRPEV